ncbi:unnamed protein product [Amoebophrya sp. A25]|nr:unnamed protein product [Amoebophrya sp. A25]|eukprot:GSA25T00027493001.1
MRPFATIFRVTSALQLWFPIPRASKRGELLQEHQARHTRQPPEALLSSPLLPRQHPGNGLLEDHVDDDVDQALVGRGHGLQRAGTRQEVQQEQNALSPHYSPVSTEPRPLPSGSALTSLRIFQISVTILLFVLAMGSAVFRIRYAERVCKESFITLANVCAAGMFLGMSMNHLLPEAFELAPELENPKLNVVGVGAFCGYMLILFCERVVGANPSSNKEAADSLKRKVSAKCCVIHEYCSDAGCRRRTSLSRAQGNLLEASEDLVLAEGAVLVAPSCSGAIVKDLSSGKEDPASTSSRALFGSSGCDSSTSPGGGTGAACSSSSSRSTCLTSEEAALAQKRVSTGEGDDALVVGDAVVKVDVGGTTIQAGDDCCGHAHGDSSGHAHGDCCGHDHGLGHGCHHSHGHHGHGASRSSDASHGHLFSGEDHGNHDHYSTGLQQGGKGAYIMMLALSVHSVFEGIVIGISRSIESAMMVALCVVCHKWAAAFAIGTAFATAKIPEKKAYGYLSIFALSSPVGILLGMGISAIELEALQGCVNAVAAGTLLYIGMSEIITEEFVMTTNPGQKFISLSIGYAFILLVQMLDTD